MSGDHVFGLHCPGGRGHRKPEKGCSEVSFDLLGMVNQTKRGKMTFFSSRFGKNCRCVRETTSYKSIDFDQISLTWLKLWMAVTILGYTFSMACKFWGIAFAKIYKFRLRFQTSNGTPPSPAH